jgi:hypothetical protein
MDDSELLKRARSFDAGPPPTINQFVLDEDDDADYGLSNLRIEWRGETGWAICNGRSCLSKDDGEFEYESMPSSRTDEFIARTRFATPQEAFAYLAEWKPKQREAARKMPGMIEFKDWKRGLGA